MNKSDIIEICVATIYVVMIPVTFFIFFDEAYFTPEIMLVFGIMLALALVIRMSKFNIIGICAAAAYLAIIYIDITILGDDYIITNWMVLAIPLVIRRGKSSTIGICGVLAYISGILITFFVFDKFWATGFEMVLAFPFSIFSFGLSDFVGDLIRNLFIGDFTRASLEFWLLSFSANIIWIYFLTRFIYSVIKEPT